MKTTSIELRRVLPDCTYPEARGVLQYRVIQEKEFWYEGLRGVEDSQGPWITVPTVVLPAKEFLKILK